MSNETAIETLQEKIDDLNQQAWELRVTDLPKAFELSKESVKLARTINYPKGLAEGLRSLGFSYVRLFKNDEAAPLLKESLSLFQTLNDRKGQAVIYEYLGIIERNWGNLGASLDLLIKANEIVQQTGPLEVEITCSYQLGVTYKHLGNHENALDYLYRALSLAKSSGNNLMVAYTTNIIGSIYFDNGDYKHALDCYQQGLVIRRESNDKWGEAGSLDNIGFTYLKLNDLDKAIDYCKQSLAICQGTGDKKGEANTLLHLGEIYEQAGDIKQAADFSNASLEIRKARGDKRGETEVLLFLADLYKNRSDVEDHQIFEWLSGALKIADEIKAQDLLSKAYYNLHEYYNRKGDYKGSLAQLEAHFQIEKELHKNSINQKVANLEISHKAEVVSQRNKELIELNEQIEKANAELKIERSLERVRTAAMAMKAPADMLEVCKIISDELTTLNVKEIRNVQTAIFYEEKGSYMNYEYYAKHDRVFVTDTEFRNHPVAEKFANQMMKGPGEFFSHGFIGKEVKDWLEYQKGTNVFIDTYLETADSLNYYWYSLGPVALGMSTYFPLTEEQINLFKRFRNVFELAYRRYLDIEKALAQAREAKIEAALEKVRSRTMGMQKSNELQEAAELLFQQVKSLGVPVLSCGYNIWEKNENTCIAWMSDEAGSIQPSFAIPLTESPTFIRFYESRQKGEVFYEEEISGESLKDHYNYMRGLPVFGKIIDDFLAAGFDLPASQVNNIVNFSNGNLTFITYKSVPEAHDIFKRFAKVFDQTYTRFLDLQKAEAQAREAKIEAALEKVRSRSLAMHHSNEIKEVVKTVFEKTKELGFFQNNSVMIVLPKNEFKDVVHWTFNENFETTEYYIPAFDHPVSTEALKAWKKDKKTFEIQLDKQEKNKFLDLIFSETDYSKVPDSFKQYLYSTEAYSQFFAFEKHCGLLVDTFTSFVYSKDQKDIIIRFAKVFEQAYIRFLDLQKAEAQAREAEIELALERVRARAMAMQKPSEFVEVVNVMGEQFINLDFDIEWANFGANGFDVSEGIDTWNFAVIPGGDPISSRLFIPYFEHPLFIDAKKQLDEYKRTGSDFFEMTYGKEVKDQWLDHLFAQTFFKDVPKEYQVIQYAKPGYTTSNLILKDTWLSIGKFDARSFTDEQHNILRRFGNAFGQAYTRFLDLQRAEAQAREARIETALEKVRASTMAMQRSEDLSQTAFVLFNQFKELGQAPERIFIATFDDHDKGVIDLWGTDQGGNKLNKLFKVPVNEPTMVSKIIAGWKEKKRSVVIDLKGEELNKYLEFLKQAGIPVTEGVMTERRVQTAACFSNGVIGVTTPEPQSAEAIQLQERFAGVFDLTYTRFLDLQKAEEQAREAKIETALERVRARALAMQEPEELKEVAQVLRTEMGLLGVEELETCSIYIHEKDSETAECWYALKDPKETEKKMVADHFHLELNDTWVGREMKEFYSSDENQASIVMQGANRKEWINYCYKHSPAFSGFYGETIPDRTYHLYKFSHGYIGAAAPGEISAESWRLLRRAASVFSLAYSRFRDLTQARNDLIKLKEEKKRAEDALTELQVTQKQLVQSEKMASLGELTAGIAHEIQNPLNFVNNFSDVSNELIEELKIRNEKLKIEDQEVKELLNDIASNLEKINHHGKRADAIVKGMLQHSRSSSGQKELTDINTLADEYIRLAYHGLRAKDKFFNAKFEMDLDPSIGKINIVPQEIGRVILNLINNSFYAVNEKKRITSNGYEPIVAISTKRVNDRIEVKVKDNGNGIPKNLLDKIFQPFFTTKPTGQGTGLGLSLSYDIITKGHDGEIKVETKEGEGSEFIISLPMN